MNKNLQIIFSLCLISILLGFGFGIFIIFDQSKPIDPNTIEWKDVDFSSLLNPQLPWIQIKNFKYSILNNELYFFLQWNNSVPNSLILNNNDLTSPRYFFYNKIIFTWILPIDRSTINYEGYLLTDLNQFSHFQLLKGKNDFTFYPNEQIFSHTIPFINKTSIAFKLTYQGLKSNLLNIRNITITTGTEYLAYSQFIPSFTDINNIIELKNNTITIDGNKSDWITLNSSIKTFIPDPINKNGFIFPIFSNVSIIRTSNNMVGIVNLDSNFMDLLRDKGAVQSNFDWDIILGMHNESLYCDYAFHIVGSYNFTGNFFTTSSAHIEELAGPESGFTDNYTWMISNNNSFIGDSLEFYFPFNILEHSGSLDGFEFHFYSSLILDFMKI